MYIEFLVAAISLLLLWVVADNYFPTKKRPPGPFRLPIIGNTLNLVNKKPAFVTFRDLGKSYGPVTFLHVGRRPGIIVNEFETAKALLNSESWIDRPLSSFVLERPHVDSLGIIFSSGGGWREMRRFSMWTLRDFGFGKQTSMQDPLEDEVKDLLAHLDKRVTSSKEAVIRMKHLFNVPVLNLLWGMVSSVRTAEDDVKIQRLTKLVDNMTNATNGASILDVFPELRHVAPDLTGATLMKKGFRELEEYFRELLHSRREQGVEAEDKRDFIDMFIKEIDKHKSLGNDSKSNHYTEDQFVATINDLFAAGSDTSSNTMEFAVYYVMKNPEVQKKVQEEIDKVVGRGRLPTNADRPSMPYTEATLLEIQRMANVVPMTGRNSTEDCIVAGYEIDKGTICMVNMFGIHMDTSFWGDPFTFRPERFLDSNNSIIPSKAARVIPFGAGKRVCLGEQMARTTIFSYFTGLLQNYSFEEVEDDPEFKAIPENPQEPEETWFRKYVHVGFTLSLYAFKTKLIKRS